MDLAVTRAVLSVTRAALCQRAPCQFLGAYLTKQLVDKLTTVTLIGKPAPEIKDLVYYQV